MLDFMKYFRGNENDMKEIIRKITYQIEDNFFLTVIRHGLTMMIPLILVGGIACALMNLPFENYAEVFQQSKFAWLYNLFQMVYQGTFGLFSIILVITLSLSYGMERNETVDKVALYVIVALGAFGAQLNIGSPHFSADNLGTKGSFSAVLVTLFACFLYSKLKDRAKLSLKNFTNGMEGVCANAMHTLLPAASVIGVVALINQLLSMVFHVCSIHELLSNLLCGFFGKMDNGFLSGLLYTVLLHVIWICGFHGSHLLEPVAQTNFLNVSEESFFSKSFFDTYVVMGGCGTTICVLLALLIFFRKDRIGKFAKIASFTVIFNLNEVLNFGIPIILNPVLAIPFILTPVVIYLIAYGATAAGFVPALTQEISWSTPVLFSGYMATGSVRGIILQVICILVGIGIYLPFLRIHKRVQENYAKEQVKKLVKELQECEQEKETPKFLTRADRLGLISRMLLQDLEAAIEKEELYMLYQPQMDDKGNCLGAEALLRWQHPLYGFIYPPLIIYLAKEGGLLPKLEEKVFEMTAAAIQRTSEEYDGDFKISVNITAKSLLWEIEECIDRCLKKYDIPAENMWIEITEQDVISNANQVVDKLNRIKLKGHTLLIDDFGMGHTSLIYLQYNLFNVVKLDGSLVKKLLESKANQKIVASIVELGRELGVKVIAEYVENEELRDKLLELGCTWYQGYMFSKPIPLEEFITYLKQHNE